MWFSFTFFLFFKQEILNYFFYGLPQDCPPDAGDFRSQQCSAHADVPYQGQFHEWLPVYNDPDNPCSLKCRAKASGHMVELAPKVLDGTRCYTESLDMCISGVCQVGQSALDHFCFWSARTLISLFELVLILFLWEPKAHLIGLKTLGRRKDLWLY